jgi:hypothetical protein
MEHNKNITEPIGRVNAGGGCYIRPEKSGEISKSRVPLRIRSVFRWSNGRCNAARALAGQSPRRAIVIIKGTFVANKGTFRRD